MRLKEFRKGSIKRRRNSKLCITSVRKFEKVFNEIGFRLIRYMSGLTDTDINLIQKMNKRHGE